MRGKKTDGSDLGHILVEEVDGDEDLRSER